MLSYIVPHSNKVFVMHYYHEEMQNIMDSYYREISKKNFDADLIEREIDFACDVFLQFQLTFNPRLAKKTFSPGAMCIYDLRDIHRVFSLDTSQVFNVVRLDSLPKYGYEMHTHTSYGCVGVRSTYAFSAFSTRSVDSMYIPDACSYCCHILSRSSLKTCSGCGIAKYCSAEHQKAHWKVHKHHCKRLIKEVD